MRTWRPLSLASCLMLLLGSGPVGAAEVERVIHISVDGGGSSYLQELIDAGSLPNFKRMQEEGAWTNNARCDFDYSVTLPNHTSQITGRGVVGAAGHNWTSNSDPGVNETIHSNKGSYVASAFDVAHDHGLLTGAYVGKSKFSLFRDSYDATNGADDATGPDNGKNKIDTFEYLDSNSAELLSRLKTTMTGSSPLHYAFFHYTETDGVGHAKGWGSDEYDAALVTMDGYLGEIFAMIENDPDLNGKTAILLTADHGGVGTGHGSASNALNYTIPFYVWGPGVAAGADLYALNSSSRLDPGAGRPDDSAAVPPIRNGDAANLALDLLGLGPVPGSSINAGQTLLVPEPSTMSLPALGGFALALLGRNRGRRGFENRCLG